MTSIQEAWSSLLGITQVEVNAASFVEARAPSPAPHFSPHSTSDGGSNNTYRGCVTSTAQILSCLHAPRQLSHRVHTCYDWNLCPPPTCICRNHNPQCDGIWGWDLWKLVRFRFGHDSRAPQWDWYPFMKSLDFPATRLWGVKNCYVSCQVYGVLLEQHERL